MPKPATLPEIATDTNFSTSPAPGVNGTPTKVEPTEDQKDEGFVPGTGFVGQHWNWYLHNIYTWVQYLNGLPTDNDFRNAAFTWGGVHTHTAAAAFNAGISVATGASFAGGLTVSSGNVQFTLGNLSLLTGSIEADGDVLTDGDFRYISTRTRSATFDGAGGQDDTATWIPANSIAPGAVQILIVPGSPAVYYKQIWLPEGALVVTLRAGLSLGNNASDPLRAALVYVTNAGAETPVASCAKTTSGASEVNSGAFTHSVSNVARRYYVKLTSSSADGSANSFRYMDVVYNDPGPKNFGGV